MYQGLDLMCSLVYNSVIYSKSRKEFILRVKTMNAHMTAAAVMPAVLIAAVKVCGLQPIPKVI